MAGSLQPRVKTWVTLEDVVYSDLNAEFDNVLLAMQPLLIDDYSATVSQMQTVTDPGEVGTESQATTMAGELARVRQMIKEITGEDYWYESPISSLEGLANAVGTGLTDNRLISGLVISGSQQPGFLIANGAAKTVKCDGTPTNFSYSIDGVEYTISTDVTLTGLTAAPSSANTCLINDAVAAAQDWTKYMGENGTEIPVDNMDAGITALVGSFAAFKIGSTEYFTAYVDSTTRLTRAKRGYFFDSTNAAVPRLTYSNNDTITLMKLTWVFATTAGALTATYNNPVWSDDEPSSPSLGDYWFDISANTWKVYGVGSYSVANAILIGVCIQDTTNTVAARSFEFFANYDSANTAELVYNSATVVKSRWPGAITNVWGATIKNEHNLHSWDITVDRDSGVSESSATMYYFYLTETGDKVISNVRPHDRREDLGGYYHTHKSWRCLGWALNNASSDLTDVESVFRRYPSNVMRSVIVTDYPDARDESIVLSGASFTSYLPSAVFMRGRTLEYIHGGTSLTQVYTLDGFASETIGSAVTVALYTAGEVLRIRSDGSNWRIISHFAKTAWVDAGAVTIGATTTPPVKGTITLDKMWWSRDGGDALLRYEFRQTVAGTAGTGDYLVPVSSIGTIRSAEVTYFTTVIGNTNALYTAGSAGNVSIARGTGSSADNGTGFVCPFDTNNVRFIFMDDLVGAWCATAGAGGLGNTAVCVMADFRLPMTGWLP